MILFDGFYSTLYATFLNLIADKDKESVCSSSFPDVPEGVWFIHDIRTKTARKPSHFPTFYTENERVFKLERVLKITETVYFGENGLQLC